MSLDGRKLHILKAVIDDYILTAAPVGSRAISKRTDIGLSSATIRNEMADLEEMGYLEQPHTSAGRIPSEKAYRLYVNSIMQHARLSEEEANVIKKHYSRKLNDVDEIVRQTAYVLSDVTQYTSMVLAPKFRASKLRYIHLVPLGDSRALVIIVTDAGLTKDALIRVPDDMSTEALDKLSRYLNNSFAGRRLDEIISNGIGDITGAFGEQKRFLDTMVNAVISNLDDGPKRIATSGAMNILNYPEYSDVDKARKLMAKIEQKDLLYNILSGTGDVEFTVRIGSENEDAGMHDCSVVTAVYKVGNDPIGSFGVIGPTRMDYAKVMAVMSQIGMSLTEMLTNMFEEERNQN